MDRQALKELLDFYEDAGVDTALGDAPVDRLRHLNWPSRLRFTRPHCPRNRQRRTREHRRFMRSSRRTVWPKPKLWPLRRNRWMRYARRWKGLRAVA